MANQHKPSRKNNHTKPNYVKTSRTKRTAKRKQTTSNKPKWIIAIAIAVAALIMALCAALIAKTQNSPSIENYSIEHETKLGGVYIHISIDDFNDLGFRYGDSVDVKFANGYELLDIPYYNGYYVDIDEPLLITYPGYDYIKAGVNYGDDLWLTAALNDDDTATIKLNTCAKYLDIQNSRDIHYSDTQGDTPDEVFGNFRNAKVGNLKDGIAQNVFDYDVAWKAILAVFLIIIGLGIIIKGVFKNDNDKEVERKNQDLKDDKTMDSQMAIFSGSDRTYNDEVFTGSNLVAVFGGVNLDLRNATFTKDTVIKAFCLFGGIDIKVPKDIRVQLRSGFIFGGISDDRKDKSEKTKHTIYIDAAGGFGGISIDDKLDKK